VTERDAGLGLCLSFLDDFMRWAMPSHCLDTARLSQCLYVREVSFRNRARPSVQLKWVLAAQSHPYVKHYLGLDMRRLDAKPTLANMIATNPGKLESTGTRMHLITLLGADLGA